MPVTGGKFPLTPPTEANSLANLFKKSSGSWDCPTCIVSNNAEHVTCPACETPKPGGSSGPKPPTVQPAIPKPTGLDNLCTVT